jgi:hypothetical protein
VGRTLQRVVQRLALILAGSITTDLEGPCSTTHKMKIVSTDNVQHNCVVINRSVKKSLSIPLENYELNTDRQK